MILVITLLLGLYVGYNFPLWLTDLVNFVTVKKARKKLLPVPVDNARLCQTTHKWTEATTVNQRGEFSKAYVCTICGFIPSRDLMLTVETLEKMTGIWKSIELDELIINDFATMEEDTLKKHFSKEIEGGFDFEKILQVYKAGQTMQERFILYRIAKKEELEPKEELSNE